MEEEELDEYIKQKEQELIEDFEFACKCYIREILNKE